MVETLDLDLIASSGGDLYTRSAGHYGINHRLIVVDITIRTLNHVGRSSTTQHRSIIYFSLSTW